MTQYCAEKQWISFSVGRETYALPVVEVREVVPYEYPVPVPGAPAGVEGVLNHRGEVISVISAHELLRETSRSSGELWRIMVMDTSAGLLGMSVELVREIIAVNPEDIHEGSRGAAGDCVLGTVKTGDDLVILMDMQSAVASMAPGAEE